ncbi:MAG: signal peptidase I [Oscillospiraceae bacterium]|nr:signal peptidase I [Oscillospiraceae bacterium]
MKRRLIKRQQELPTTPQLEDALAQENRRKRFRSVLRSTVFVLATVAAVSVLIATLLFPVMRIYGSSMNPTLEDGEIVVALKIREFKPGDLVAFYYNNKLLIKRVIGQPGDWINLLDDGTVCVNGTPLDEPYVSELSVGTCDLELPYQVPADQYFVMGDHRSTSIDSRSSTVGCVAKDQVVGKILLRVWPLAVFGTIS